jgi:predicted nucleic acid-binding protein
VKAEGIDRFFNESNHVVRTAVYYKWNLITVDPDDNKFVDCAIAANADYIVTNDKHFNILKEINFPKVSCITIEEFIEILKKH